MLSPTVFEVLRRTAPGRGGEIQLTDALQELIGLEPLHGVVFRGRRYDTGDRLDYLKTVVRLASERDDLGPPLLAWLREWLPSSDTREDAVDEHLAEVLQRHPAARARSRSGCSTRTAACWPRTWSRRTPLPGFDNSAMDGYAVRVADLASLPASLPVDGDIAAGPASPLRVHPGSCVRIMTGAMIPPGADAVVPVEWTDGGVQQVTIDQRPDVGAFIRRAGEDVKAGELVLPKGTHLGSAQIGLAAAVGRPRLRVRPRPRVVVVSTGSELVEPGTPLQPGQIYDCNSMSLTTACIEAGAIAYRVGIIPDDGKRLLGALEDQLVRADLLVTSGGVSVGAYDVVKEVLSRLGTVGFHKVAMQPGMPQGFGTIGPDSTPVFGLPGNPVSAMVSFEAFVRPALRRMLGVGEADPAAGVGPRP